MTQDLSVYFKYWQWPNTTPNPDEGSLLRRPNRLGWA